MAKKKTPAAPTNTGPQKREQKAAVTAGPARIINTWRPRDLIAAQSSAEYGNLSTAVSICQWLLADDRVKATLDARLDALLGLDPTFEPGKGARSKDAVKALEDDKDWWASYPESELRQILRWGILLGVAPARHNWTERTDHGGRVLPMPSFWYPQTLRFDMQTRTWFVRDSQNVEHVVVPGDGEWILHMPGGANRPWANGLWLSLGRWCLLKSFAIQDWARHSEKAATLVATSPEDATQTQRSELAADLQASGSDRVVALAAGFDLKAVEISANTRDIYDAQINAADDAIAIVIRGSNLTTEVKAGSGSKAATESHAKTGDGAKLKADANALGTTLFTQSLPWYAEFNFGDSKAAPFPVWPVEPEEDKAARATMVKTLGEGLTVWDKLGADIDFEAVAEEFGLSTFITGRSREREPDPVPPAPGTQPEPTEGTGAGGKVPKAKQSASVPRMSAGSGFVNGQMYADDLVDSGAKLGGDALKPLIGSIIDAVNDATDYESLRTAVLKLYGESLPPEQLRAVLEHCMVLAEMAGHLAVKQDAN